LGLYFPFFFPTARLRVDRQRLSHRLDDKEISLRVAVTSNLIGNSADDSVPNS